MSAVGSVKQPVLPILLLCLLWPWLGGCSDLPLVRQPWPTTRHDPPSISLSVVNHGWHTGLIVPAADLNRVLPELAHRFGQPAFYEIGWGDQGFYQSPKITLGLALQALFWSRGTVVHVVAVPISPQQSFPRSSLLSSCMTPAELAGLLDFLSDSFQRNANGQLLSLGPGLYGDAQFYAGVGRYDWLNTCNRWTAKGLNSAGHPLPLTFTLTANDVMRNLAAHRRFCPPAAPALPDTQP